MPFLNPIQKFKTGLLVWSCFVSLSCSLEPVPNSDRVGLIPAILEQRLLEDPYASTHFENALQTCNSKELEKLLDEHPECLAHDKFRENEVMEILLKNDCPEIFDTLLKRGLSRSALSSALRVIVRKGRIDLLNSFSIEIIDVNVFDEKGQTPLTYAVELGDYDMVKKLLELGARPSLPDLHNDTPFSISIQMPNKGNFPNKNETYDSILMLLKGEN